MKYFYSVFLTLLLLCAFQAKAAAPVMVDGAWLESHFDDPDLTLVDMSMDDTQY
jgi:hypothetical protein